MNEGNRIAFGICTVLLVLVAAGCARQYYRVGMPDPESENAPNERYVEPGTEDRAIVGEIGASGVRRPVYLAVGDYARLTMVDGGLVEGNVLAIEDSVIIHLANSPEPRRVVIPKQSILMVQVAGEEQKPGEMFFGALGVTAISAFVALLLSVAMWGPPGGG